MKDKGILTPQKTAQDLNDYSLIVHSHLQWDWVWQRPQQFISRLSHKHRVLFVEAPEICADTAATEVQLRQVDQFPNVHVVKITVPANRSTDLHWVDQERGRAVESLLSGPLRQKFSSIIQWFYDPMAATAFAGRFNEQLIVYDCMDELSLFRGAAPELVQRERELLRVADVVFAGGPKIWRAKRKLNRNCFCYGCGVDAEHFGRARDPKLVVAKELTDVPRPVFGYIGVVDERIDYDLLAKLADSTKGSIAMVGPSTKIDIRDLPRRNNLHWIGGRQYTDLPSYAKAFDVCIMPFAMNEATRFINPTKALEYMATGRPIVSTPVEDVIAQFNDVITIADGEATFAEACARAAAQPEVWRIEQGLALAALSSWDSIVARLEQRIAEALCSRRALSMDAA